MVLNTLKFNYPLVICQFSTLFLQTKPKCSKLNDFFMGSELSDVTRIKFRDLMLNMTFIWPVDGGSEYSMLS